jgi:hypothetical protein
LEESREDTQWRWGVRESVGEGNEQNEDCIGHEDIDVGCGIIRKAYCIKREKEMI